MPDFLGIERLALGPWQALERGVQRLFVHAGFMDVRLVGGSGDEGADIVGELRGKIWVVQAKFRSAGQLVGAEAVGEVTVAVDRYAAKVAIVATNSGFNAEAIKHAKKLSSDIGVPFYLWNGDFLIERTRRLAIYPERRNEPRPYQSEAIEAINVRIVQGHHSGLLLMATGLGKTRVAAGVIEQWIYDHPKSEVLILAPSLALVPQLESALWPYLPKWVATHLLTGSEKPSFEGGVTIATEQSMLNRVEESQARYGLVIVDEAHHAPADAYRRLLTELEPTFLLGMTATPWRGDERQLDELFGQPTYSVSVIDGMQLGYLAEVDYRMLVDDIDWNWVQQELSGSLSIKELNRKLFVPERDEAVVAKVRDHAAQTPGVRCIVFCRSIEHADTISRLLRADGHPTRLLHSNLDRKDATRALHDFRSGAVPFIVTVDMLNEGIDIPEVNLIVFLRVTHSRRIFIQQLGRGLRIAEGKSVVRVLDFVSDVRRIAAAMEMNKEAREFASKSPADARIRYPTGAVVKFEGDKALSFFNEYLSDVSELEDDDDNSKLRFPR